MNVLPLADWRDFYVTVGTASGAIIGAAFVVASLTSGSDKRALGIRGFITPTAVYLGSVLIVSAVLTIPVLTPVALCLLLGVAGLGGLVYAVIVITRIWRAKLDAADRFWYCAAPVAAYLALLAAAAMLFQNALQALILLCAALMALLVIGMHNLWDMATFMILRDRDSA